MSVEIATPDWLGELLAIDLPEEGGRVSVRGQTFTLRGGILRAGSGGGADQQETERTFAYKWSRRETFESDESLGRMRAWLVERYGNVAEAPWWAELGPCPLLLDAGCGAAMSALALFGSRLSAVRYLGVDASSALDVAAERVSARGFPAAFLQADIARLPLQPGSAGVIFAEGVLHHTGDTRGSFHALVRLLAPGGRILFYVYRKKGPIREFTDDYVRDQLAAMSPREAWEAVLPITKLGQALGDLNIEVDIPQSIDLLEIPAGRIPLQRLFYWHVLKAYHHPNLSLDELNHINFDWYAPAIAHRHTVDEVREWCAEADLPVEHEDVQLSGITVIARKRASAGRHPSG